MPTRRWFDDVKIEELLVHCTPVQAEAMQALKRGKTYAQVASELEKPIRWIADISARVKAKFDRYNTKNHILHGHGDGEGLPAGYAVKGVSSLLRVGDQLHWVKTDRDKEQEQAAAEAALRGFLDELTPAKPVKKWSHGPEELLNMFVVTDYHLGMQAWGEETRGEDWDLGIAEDLLWRWFQAALSRVTPAKYAVFAQLGDFLHWDGLDAVTPTAGHVLDADTRFQKVVRTAIRVLRRCIGMMLENHEHVHVIMAEGNHDIASSVWLREMFHAFYENEPRVTVDLSPDPYYAYQHGDVGLFFHHGHKRKTRELDRVLAKKFKRIFGESEHHYGHSGHFHFAKEENGLMTIEQHRTLAAHDAYASRGGWNSGREAKVITYHKKYGEVGRAGLTPEMVRDLT